ncbi:hypothetical protein, partial [Leptotrichia sp. OH3620_COT-345]|uniref:hypothetical protein n=1 Tax=Leptotrichia sp. OH3620_COT-345 TaxID=2491048 RepID=UPI0018F3360B
IIKETSNIRGEISGNEGIKLIGEKLNNLTGVIKSNKKIDLDVKDTRNIKGYILSDGLTKEDIKQENKETKNVEDIKTKEIGINITGTLDNTKG